MIRPNYNHFAAVPNVGMQRSAFDQQFTYKTTLDAGYIIPCMQPIEILPGDTLNLRLTSFSRLATLITPLMDNIHMMYAFFFVPNRLVWDDFEEFICADVNGPSGTVPQIVAGSNGFAVGSLADYFGLPVGVAGLSVSALPFRAYNLIFNEWWKREDLVSESPFYSGSNDESYDDGDYVLRRRSKRPDYFVSCNLWPQKGPGVELPLGANAPVITGDPHYTGPNTLAWSVANSSTLYNPATDCALGLKGGDSTGFTHINYPLAGPDYTEGSVFLAPANLYADLSSATAATINSLRLAFQIQRLYERDALAGNGRYVEVLRSHFQVISPDARLQRPEYLGGGTVPINIHTVVQNSQTSTTPQGTLTGYGVGAGSSIGFNKSFVEHGFVIGLMCIYADVTYQQGVDRFWSRKGRFDFYWPVLAHLGEQAVLNQEIYAQGPAVKDANNVVIDGKPFGYQERWAEYRYGVSKITGKLRSGVSGSLNVWHLAQQFTSLPVLGETFVSENPPIDRAIAVVNEPQFIYDSVVRARFVRPMPMYSVPGLVDHF